LLFQILIFQRWFADVNKDGTKDIVLVQSSYNLDNPNTQDCLTAIIIKNGKAVAEKVIFDGNKSPFPEQALFGHIWLYYQNICTKSIQNTLLASLLIFFAQ